MADLPLGARIALAIRAFFSLLLAGRLPAGTPRALLSGGPPAEPPEEAIGPSPEVADATAPFDPDALRQDGAVATLALLQRGGRLVDFLMEDIAGYDDAQVGAAVRTVHDGCRAALEEHATLEPILPGEEGAPAVVPSGFDPAAIRLTGDVRGEPPFQGTLRHHGWKIQHIDLPPTAGASGVAAPAEVEL